jgi:hypothetical protein
MPTSLSILNGTTNFLTSVHFHPLKFGEVLFDVLCGMASLNLALHMKSFFEVA